MEHLASSKHILNSIHSLISYAESYVFIACPFPSFSSKTSEIISSLRYKPYVKLFFVFGKDSYKGQYRMPYSDYRLLKSLPNVEIRYNPHLHGKLYVNEKYAISTSMNLHHSSFNSNYENGTRNKIMSDGFTNEMAKIWNSSEVYFNHYDYYVGEGLLPFALRSA